MSIQIYNTLSKRKEEFKPLEPGRYAQGFGKVIADDPVNLILRVRYGAHEGVQEMINMIGAAAGLGPAIVTEPK